MFAKCDKKALLITSISDIIQILQPLVIDYLSPHLYIVELLIKTLLPVPRVLANEDDILIFSRNVRKQVVS